MNPSSAGSAAGAAKGAMHRNMSGDDQMSKHRLDRTCPQRGREWLSRMLWGVETLTVTEYGTNQLPRHAVGIGRWDDPSSYHYINWEQLTK